MKKIDNVYIFKMSTDLCIDYIDYQDLQKNYFDKELKENKKYYVPKSNKYFHKKGISENDLILFLYNNMFIAIANVDIKNGIYFHKLDDLEKYNYEDYSFEYYYALKNVMSIPAIYKDELKKVLEDNINLNTRIPIQKIIIKKYYQDKLYDFLISGKGYKLPNLSKFNILRNNPTILREINLYNYENIHTAYLSNFLKKDNIYKLENKPMKEFLKLLIKKDSSLKNFDIDNIDNYSVNSQSIYKNNKIKIVPDITIDISNYLFVIEGKVCSYENISPDGIKQIDKYKSYFEENKIKSKKIIYVYLTLRRKDTSINTINITFKEIYESIYKKFLNNCKNRYTLDSYLKSLCFLVDNKFNFEIEDIPSYNFINEKVLLNNYQKIKNIIEKIANLELSIQPEYEKYINYRYFLVLLYNSQNISLKEKEIIKKCYNNLVAYNK